MQIFDKILWSRCYSSRIVCNADMPSNFYICNSIQEISWVFTFFTILGPNSWNIVSNRPIAALFRKAINVNLAHLFKRLSEIIVCCCCLRRIDLSWILECPSWLFFLNCQYFKSLLIQKTLFFTIVNIYACVCWVQLLCALFGWPDGRAGGLPGGPRRLHPRRPIPR